ncbi:hypothetical protein [Nocardiopsis salina]|uniref:hypothetical protein n=1 Tax=Nocardiopsis salina TaxID=245836 RepID=UPI00034CA928|nr:hypothetical protein [Nocardiopsis salina]
MSTSREDEATDSTTDADVSPETHEDRTGDGTTGAPQTGADFVQGSRPQALPRGGGVFSPESLSITGMLLLLPVLVGGRLLERVAWFGVGSGTAEAAQLAVLRSELLITGAIAGLAVLLGSVSLFTGDDRTRAWARWAASAVVIAGVVSLLMCVIAFVGIG